MPSFSNKIKAIRSIFGLNSSIKSNLSELKEKRKIIKRKKHVENLIALKTKAQINNENDAIKNPFDLKVKAKINNKNDLK